MKAAVQLAETATDSDRYLEDSAWAVEQKLDGHRVLVHCNGKVVALNRKGEQKALGLPRQVSSYFEQLKGEWQFDGELVNGTFHAFDLLLTPHGDLKPMPWTIRRQVLEQVFTLWESQGLGPEIRITKAYMGTDAKRRLFEACQDREGVMFKKQDAPYRLGRQRTWLKYKFVKTCEAIVTELNRKGKAEAISLGLFDSHGQLHNAGGCRLLPRFAGRVAVGDVVEVRYLFSTDENKLYQPVLMHLRPDKVASECTQAQLVYTNREIVDDG